MNRKFRLFAFQKCIQHEDPFKTDLTPNKTRVKSVEMKVTNKQIISWQSSATASKPLYHN